jgi:hypothetical protein
MENRYGLDTKVGGKSIDVWLADLAEKNDKLEMEIERGKLAVAISKQMNNHSRLRLDAVKFELKKKEFEAKQGQTQPA